MQRKTLFIQGNGMFDQLDEYKYLRQVAIVDPKHEKKARVAVTWDGVRSANYLE